MPPFVPEPIVLFHVSIAHCKHGLLSLLPSLLSSYPALHKHSSEPSEVAVDPSEQVVQIVLAVVVLCVFVEHAVQYGFALISPFPVKPGRHKQAELVVCEVTLLVSLLGGQVVQTELAVVVLYVLTEHAVQYGFALMSPFPVNPG